MHSFDALAQQFAAYFNRPHFPQSPPSLYEPAAYILKLGGKRVRPVLCLMGNELFEEIHADAWSAATAVELFHNFTLIHDDIMDKAPLRRGKPTVHGLYGDSTALLAGDVVFVVAYEYLSKLSATNLPKILALFNKTAKEVCEGQQLDMDFEKETAVDFDAYINMITLKTSVVLAASLKMGAMIGGASERNQNLLYEFGKKLGLAFQVQDDYLDAFGDPKKFGKQVGGDIMVNKKTFLLLHTQQVASAAQKAELESLMAGNAPDKVEKVKALYKACGADGWAKELSQQWLTEALQHLDDIAVLSRRKEHLHNLATQLVQREF